MIRLMLVDDHQLIRDGLRRSFDRAGGFDVVAEAASVAEARDLFEEMALDVVVTDVRMPDGTGLQLTAELRAQNPELGIVVLTMYAGDDTVLAAMGAGASALVSKDAPSDDVINAARHAVTSPRMFTAKDLAGAMFRGRAATAAPGSLTEREAEILPLLADGLGVSAISKRLFISDSTTKTHISRLYEKLGASNRAQAIMSAVRSGMLDTSDRGLQTTQMR